MKNVNWWKVSSIGLGAALLMAATNEPSQREDGLRPEVVAALKRAFPEGRIASTDTDRKDGERIHEVRLKYPQGENNVLAKVSESGEILELDEDFPREQVPRHVEQALRKAFPDAKIVHAEKRTKMEIFYSLDVTQGKRKHEVKITRRGRIFEVENRDRD